MCPLARAASAEGRPPALSLMARTLPAYVSEDDLKPYLPVQWLTEAADDDGDGEGETMGDICAAASDSVDAYLQGRYELPISDPAGLAKLKEAAQARALWLCYQRRGRSGDNNPYEAEWGRWSKKLEAIESGKAELIISPAAAVRPPARISAVKTPMKTVRTGGGNLV